MSLVGVLQKACDKNKVVSSGTNSHICTIAKCIT